MNGYALAIWALIAMTGCVAPSQEEESDLGVLDGKTDVGQPGGQDPGSRERSEMNGEVGYAAVLLEENGEHETVVFHIPPAARSSQYVFTAAQPDTARPADGTLTFLTRFFSPDRVMLGGSILHLSTEAEGTEADSSGSRTTEREFDFAHPVDPDQVASFEVTVVLTWATETRPPSPTELELLLLTVPDQ